MTNNEIKWEIYRSIETANEVIETIKMTFEQSIAREKLSFDGFNYGSMKDYVIELDVMLHSLILLQTELCLSRKDFVKMESVINNIERCIEEYGIVIK